LDKSLLELITSELHKRNMRLTMPRRRIMEIFALSGRLQTAQDLYLSAKKEGLPVGLTTIYRLLGILTEIGLARTYLLNGETKYIFCSPQHHHHLICTRCGMYREIFECLVLPMETTDFQPESHHLDFFGVCYNCAEKCKTAPKG